MKRRILIFGVLPLLGQQCLLGIFLTGTGCTSPEMTVSEPPTHRGLLATSVSFQQARPKQSASVKPAASTKKTAPKNTYLKIGTHQLDLTGDGKPETIHVTLTAVPGTNTEGIKYRVQSPSGKTIFSYDNDASHCGGAWLDFTTKPCEINVLDWTWDAEFETSRAGKHIYRRTVWRHDPRKGTYQKSFWQWTVGKYDAHDITSGKTTPRYWEKDLGKELSLLITSRDWASLCKFADPAALNTIRADLKKIPRGELVVTKIAGEIAQYEEADLGYVVVCRVKGQGKNIHRFFFGAEGNKALLFQVWTEPESDLP